MEEVAVLKKNWIWILVLGILLIALGIFAIGSSILITFLSIIFFGCLLIISGIAQLSYLFFVKEGRHSTYLLVTGLLSAIVGLLLLFHPKGGAETVTLLLAMFYIVAGLLRLFDSLLNHQKHMFWSMLYGIVVFFLGVIILANLPIAGLIFIGLVIGIELLFNGISWVALAIAAKAS
jgi:uncharacterized membrane protein HdeD (DUF308 family)